jgi:uncharacterized protein
VGTELVKTYQRLFIVALLALAMTILLSPWAAAAWSDFVAHSNWQSHQFSFSRIFSRVFMISGISLFIIFRRFLKLGSLENLGLKPLVNTCRDISLGVLLSLGSLVGLVVVMSLMDIFTAFFRLSVSKSLIRCGSALLTAVTVGTVEEIFFRGIFFKGLREDLGRFRGYLYAAIFFAAIHFVRPTHDAVEINGLTGIRYLIDSFHAFLDPVALLPGFIGLFSIGLILCHAYERTGKLYLSIGLHAGWIFGLKTIRVFGDFARQDLGWIFGSTDPKIVSGVATWIGVVFVGLIIHALTQRRSRLEYEQESSVVGPADLSTGLGTPSKLSKL